MESEVGMCRKGKDQGDMDRVCFRGSRRWRRVDTGKGYLEVTLTGHGDGLARGEVEGSVSRRTLECST